MYTCFLFPFLSEETSPYLSRTILTSWGQKRQRVNSGVSDWPLSCHPWGHVTSPMFPWLCRTPLGQGPKDNSEQLFRKDMWQLAEYRKPTWIWPLARMQPGFKDWLRKQIRRAQVPQLLELAASWAQSKCTREPSQWLARECLPSQTNVLSFSVQAGKKCLYASDWGTQVRAKKHGDHVVNSIPTWG